AATQTVAEFEPLYAEHRSALLAAREARWRHQEAVADVRLRLAESQHQARIAQERNAAAVQALEALQSELQRLNASEQAGSRGVGHARAATRGRRSFPRSRAQGDRGARGGAARPRGRTCRAADAAGRRPASRAAAH